MGMGVTNISIFVSYLLSIFKQAGSALLKISCSRLAKATCGIILKVEVFISLLLLLLLVFRLSMGLLRNYSWLCTWESFL